MQMGFWLNVNIDSFITKIKTLETFSLIFKIIFLTN